MTREQLLEELAEAREEIARLRISGTREDSACESQGQFLRRAIEFAPVPIMLHTEDGEVLQISDKWTELTGYRHADLPTIAAWSEKACGVRDPGIGAAMDSPFAAEAVAHQGEFELRTACGELRTWDIWSGPLGRLQDGRRIAISTAMDVTGRRRAEEALRSSEERYRGVLEESVAAIYLFDVEKNFIEANQAGVDLLGYPKEELLRMGIPDVDADPVVVHPAHQKLLVGGRLINFEHQLRRKDGEVITVLNNSCPLTDASGTVVGMQSTLVDISKLKRAEEDRRCLEAQLQQAQKLESLGVLASGIAHDFNNLLLAIYGNVDLALLELEARSPVREYLADAKTASRRAADLIRQILTYAGKTEVGAEDVDLNVLLQEMTTLLRASISKKTVIQFDLDENLLPTQGDPTQIRQIVMNLLTNAAQAIGEEHGVISLETRVVECDQRSLNAARLGESVTPGTFVRLRISDTGPGMSPDVQHRIFDPFFTTKTEGSGLGLSAVHGIVRSHGGAIEIESEVDQGTSFTVLFPAALQTNKTQEADPVSEDWRSSGTILIVDDEELARNLVANAVRRIGFAVLTASNGVEAIEVFRRHEEDIDCVLLDSKMPHMSGSETFEVLRGIRTDLPVILCSGFSEEESTKELIGKGLAGFMQKPYAIAELGAKLHEVMGDYDK